MTAAVSVTPQTGHRNLIGLSRDELAAELAPHGIDGFRLRQVWHWLYHRGGRNFAEMTTLSKPVRALLEAHYTVDRPEVATAQLSEDGTRKWLRSEEHTSELQSLMRTSYAVFCLKKKNIR